MQLITGAHIQVLQDFLIADTAFVRHPNNPFRTTQENKHGIHNDAVSQKLIFNSIKIYRSFPSLLLILHLFYYQ